MASGNMGRRTSSSASSQKNNTTSVKTRKEVMDKIAFLEKDMARTKERMDNATNPLSRLRAESAYNRLMNSYDKAMIEYDDLPQEPLPQRAPPVGGGSREVKPAPGSDLKDKGPARSESPVPQNRPATVNTQSKKPLAKRIMEALGDKRSMEDAIRDRKMTEEMERERMGQKKGGMGQKKKDSVKKAYGGMGQKKKDSVKKAYGGMVKKKHGGSANKVNMKAGFTRRGCSKG
jgi:hypothetical protein